MSFLVMPRVELPLDLTIRIDQGYRVRKLSRPVPEEFRAAIRAPRGRPREPGSRVQVKPAEPEATTLSFGQWDLPHDFRKVHAEVETASRFLEEVSVLLNLLIEIQEHSLPPLVSVVEVGADGPQLTDQVLQHLFSGLSVYSFPGASILKGESFQRETLLFETLGLSVESPLRAKQRPFLTRDNLRDVVAVAGLAISFLTFIGAARSAEQPHQTIGCTTTFSTPSRRSAAAQQDIARDYASDLREGGVKAVQGGLAAVGCRPGRIDGVDGPQTQSAFQEFCAKNSIIAKDYNSQAFINALARAMAQAIPPQSAR